MAKKTSGAEHQVKSEMVLRYREMLEPLGMYVDNLEQMLFFQQTRFFRLSGIRCDYGGRSKVRPPPCGHVACPFCWHKTAVSYLTSIAEAGQPLGLRIRVVEGVPPAFPYKAFVDHLTQGETPWVFDRRCETTNVHSTRLVILSSVRDARPGDGGQQDALCGDDTVSVLHMDYRQVSDALMAWFSEAPPPFTQADYEDFVVLTKDFVFGDSVVAYPIAPGYVSTPGVDDQLLGL